MKPIIVRELDALAVSEDGDRAKVHAEQIRVRLDSLINEDISLMRFLLFRMEAMVREGKITADVRTQLKSLIEHGDRRLCEKRQEEEKENLNAFFHRYEDFLVAVAKHQPIPSHYFPADGTSHMLEDLDAYVDLAYAGLIVTGPATPLSLTTDGFMLLRTRRPDVYEDIMSTFDKELLTQEVQKS